jgi:hypothetical protein
MEALSCLMALPTTKEQQSKFAELIIEQATNGYNSALKIDLQLKAIENTIELIRKDLRFKTETFSEADKFPEKAIEITGCTITKISKPVYNYSECNYSKYNHIKAQIEELKLELKPLETVLQNIKEPIADVETGEIINPATKTYTDYLTYKLGKKGFQAFIEGGGDVTVQLRVNSELKKKWELRYTVEERNRMLRNFIKSKL